MTVLLLSGDLAVISRAQGGAARAGMLLRAVAGASQAVEYCASEQASILIIDLTTPSLDVVALVREVQASPSTQPRIVAFGPHVHEGKLAAAREAGCDEVVSRGQFFAQLDAILIG